MVLRGIERSLRGMRREWQVEFQPGGAQALEAMEREPFDVVISDMRMPGMDGAHLLEQVKQRFPRTVRMALSGQSDKATILRSLGPTHQYLSKPCDVEELKQKLKRALSLRDLLDNAILKEVVSRLAAVPSLPRLWRELSHYLQSGGDSIAEAGRIVSQDIGMTTKVLQLVNSAFLGAPVQISSAARAAARIGLDDLRTLALSLGLFTPFEGSPTLAEEMDCVQKQSWQCAEAARAIALAEECAPNVVEAAYTAGFLHKIGKLVLALACSVDYEAFLRAKANEQLPAGELEYRIFGASHDQVGAYLLGLWGLPQSIVEAVAWHHQPSQAQPSAFSPLIAVHVGAAIQHRLGHTLSSEDNIGVDQALLDHLGLGGRLPAWIKAVERMKHQEAAHA